MTKQSYGLSSNQLKLLACVFMAIDHIGYFLLPSTSIWYAICRIIGRLAFPMFAYFIAEGCRYTRNKARYFLLIFAFAIVGELLFGVLDSMNIINNSGMTVFMTFTFGIALLYIYNMAVQYISKKDVFMSVFSCCALLVAIAFIVCVDIYGNSIEYGVGGVLMILFCGISKNKWIKLLGLTVGCLFVISYLYMSGYQVYMLIAVPLMLLYNGKRGQKKMKYFFYIYYPVHILVIVIIGVLIGVI